MKQIFVLFFLALASTILSQEVPKPTLIDEFPDITCEDMLARVDNFNVVLNNNPAMFGLVVLVSPKTGRDYSPHYRRLIQRTLQRRGDDAERLRFFRRKADSPGGSLWLSYGEDNAPFSDAEPWPDTPLDLSRAFVWDTTYDDSPCPTFAGRAYAKLLNTHKNLQGHIVVRHVNRKEALATGTYWIDELTEQWGVPRNRLKLIVGKRTKDFYIDFWLVPTKKK